MDGYVHGEMLVVVFGPFIKMEFSQLMKVVGHWLLLYFAVDRF